MTIREIATLAGVSASTVSRVINHPASKAAGKEVENRIWEIIRQTGYIPNISARNLKLGATTVPAQKSIACILSRSQTSNPFFSQITRAFEQEAFRLGYIVKYVFANHNTDNPETYQIVADTKIDGIVILNHIDKRELRFLTSRYKKIVYVGLNNTDTKYDQIVCDGYQAAKAAVSHLAKLGHTHIAYIGEKTNEGRYKGYLDALEYLKLPLNRNFVINTSISYEGGYTGMKKLLSAGSHVTAIFCANDLTAIGAIKAAKESGYHIPRDISIIGVDDIETAQDVSPMLTTIQIPTEELGRLAAKVLIDRIENGKRIPMKVELPFQLIKRESCSTLLKSNRWHNNKEDKLC